MINRPHWTDRIKNAWKMRSVVWLSGVHRAGKTTLAKMIPQTVYRNCDLPSVSRQLSDPEPFYDSLDKDAIVVFDEIHRLDDPSLVLKIAADVYPHLRVLATGSSTLSATKKFRDSLTGRKHMIYLPPVPWSECLNNFKVKDLDHRLLHGGLPEALLSAKKEAAFFSEWLDSFYARDIQELFGIRNRTGFMKLMHLLLRQSGGVVDYTNLARLSDLSRHTVKAHVEALSVAHAVFLLPPFHGGSRRELVHRPKCYAFDTGFVTFAKGWDNIREDDRGLLWEHLVLDSLRTFGADHSLFYWRDKSGRELDFVIKMDRQRVDVLECKVNPDHFDPSHLKVFRSLYPEGRDYVISPHVKSVYRRRFEGRQVDFISTTDIDKAMSGGKQKDD